MTFPSSKSHLRYREQAVLEAFSTKVKRLLKIFYKKTASLDGKARKMHKIPCYLSPR